jgi:Ulp1 family protease
VFDISESSDFLAKADEILASSTLPCDKFVGGNDLSAKCARTLGRGQWMSGYCIDEYMSLLAQDVGVSFVTNRRICGFKAAFCSRLRVSYEMVKRKKRLFYPELDQSQTLLFGVHNPNSDRMTVTGHEIGPETSVPDLCLLPVHSPGHWTLLVVDFKAKVFTYCDSLYDQSVTCATAVQVAKDFSDYVCRYNADNDADSYDFSGWHLKIPNNIPQQQDGYNCGVFVCQFARRMVAGLPLVNSNLCTTVADGHRRLMLAEILAGELHLS